jgi:O-antigen ligase
MPRIIGTTICILLIIYLFGVDRKKSDGVSNALWLPFIWTLFAASRPISFWLSYWFHIGTISGASGLEEGNAIELSFLSVLIAAGILVLTKRRLNWQELLTKNVWIWLFLIFAALSFSWSDYPFVSFKRWVKSLGTLIMALVILTEERPYEAIGVILRRTAYLLLPLSVLFIKYYPDLGRTFHSHGAAIYRGVTEYKNGLAALCMISCIYFAWNLLLNKWQVSESGQRLHYSIYFIILPMIAWLLYKSNSATFLACLVTALLLLISARQHAFAQNPKRLLFIGAVCIVIYGIFEFVFDVNGTIIAMLGRRPDLTNRLPMWKELLTMAVNPIVGVGFESFWLGKRLDIMIADWGMDRQAHNGYLDIYLTLGYIGLFFALAYMLSGLKKACHYLFVDYPNAILRLCFIVVFALSNWTENAFHLVSCLWMLLLFSIIDRPVLRKQ